MKLEYRMDYIDNNPNLTYPVLCLDREAYENLLEDHKCTRDDFEEHFITKCYRRLRETDVQYAERKKYFQPTFTDEADIPLWALIYNKTKQRWKVQVYWDVVRMSCIMAYWEKDKFLYFKCIIAQCSDNYKPKNRTFATFEQALEYLEQEHDKLKVWGITASYKDVFGIPAPHSFHDYTKERI